MAAKRRQRLAVWKLASCDGCQLSLLDLEDELLELAALVEIAFFREATSKTARGSFDLSLVDGSVTRTEDIELVREVRRRSRLVVPIGACATAGGIQALRNLADVSAFASRVYPRPELVHVLPSSTPIAEHVAVDFELHGCPVNPRQLLEVLSAWLAKRTPEIDAHSVCVDCKLRGNVCVMVVGTPCLGPITHAGCGALCPTYDRGCYGCYGPMESPNTASLARAFKAAGVSSVDWVRILRTFNANAPAFRQASLAEEEAASAVAGEGGRDREK
jgi:sulfhydrogenase subunit delta